MRRLFRTNFSKLFRMKSFYLFLAVMIWYPAMSNFSRYSEMLTGYPRWFEESLWVYGLLSLFIMPVMVHLFITPDYADKTIRNKLIIGHCKSKIYLSNMITMLCVTLIYFMAWNITYFGIGLPLFYKANPLKMDLLFCFEELIASLFITALLVLFAMFVSSKISAGILCISLSLILMFSGLWTKTRLAQPELIDEERIMVVVNDTYNEEDHLVPNPKFVPAGPQRDALIYFERINPGAQLIDIGDIHEVDLIWYVLYDNIMLLLIAFGGAKIYKRKDIS